MESMSEWHCVSRSLAYIRLVILMTGYVYSGRLMKSLGCPGMFTWLIGGKEPIPQGYPPMCIGNFPSAKI